MCGDVKVVLRVFVMQIGDVEWSGDAKVVVLSVALVLSGCLVQNWGY